MKYIYKCYKTKIKLNLPYQLNQNTFLLYIHYTYTYYKIIIKSYISNYFVIVYMYTLINYYILMKY